jgi:hypothetical protein
MELIRIAGEDCGEKDCEAVFHGSAGKLVIRGDLVHGDAGPTEALVEISETILLEAARALGR